METNWASDNLQVIRTLMERSALYRRALAPIMMVSGLIGLVAAIAAYALQLETPKTFAVYWFCVSLAAVAASFLLVRRQAIKESEPLWSPPTRRVSQALLPAFMTGLAAGGLYLIASVNLPPPLYLASIWVILYGLALHAAGFFMPRGIKLLGWCFIVGGIGMVYSACVSANSDPLRGLASGHAIMGAFFGVLQLAYSIYLYFTEKTKVLA
jgi:hypothetical protein